MAVEQFNSLGGYSTGIPPVQVIDASGNVVTNVFTQGNVTANAFFADSYQFANGEPLKLLAGGSNTQLQFNSDGVFDGIPNVVWDGNVLTLGHVSNIKIQGGQNGYFLQTDGAGYLTWASAGGGNTGGTPGGTNTQVQFNDSGEFGASPDLIFNQTSSELVLNGDFITANLVTTSHVVFSSASIVDLGLVSNISISGGQSGQYLTTDGAGNVSWNTIEAEPAGSNNTVQLNVDGQFVGNDSLTFNGGDTTLRVAGNLVANTITIGSGIYKFARSNVEFATSSSTANAAIVSIPAVGTSSIDYTIIATNETSNKRQVSKISAISYEASVGYNEYSTLLIGGLVANLAVGYDSGNAIADPSITLYTVPEESSTTTYKIQVTVYND